MLEGQDKNRPSQSATSVLAKRAKSVLFSSTVKPAPTPNRKPTAHEPPIITDLDQQFKVLLSATKEGPRRVGVLRRDFGLPPESIAQVMERHKNVFRTSSMFGYPIVELVPGALKEPETTFQPLFQTQAQKNAAQKKNTVKSNPSKIPPGRLLEMRDKLLELCVLARNSDWLLEAHSITLETIREVNLEYDCLNLLFQSQWGGRDRFLVSVKGVDQVPAPEPAKVEQPPVEGPKLTEEDWARMTWKPNRTEAHHRGRTVHASLINRQRNPHPDFQNL